MTPAERIALALECLTILETMDREATSAVLAACDPFTRGVRVDMHAVKNYAADAIIAEAKRRIARNTIGAA